MASFSKNRLINIFVNNGLLRKNEFEDTLRMYRERLGLNVIGVECELRRGVLRIWNARAAHGWPAAKTF